MKKIAANLLTFLLLFLGGSLYGQQSWQWGQRVTTKIKEIATDGVGNIYVLWPLSGTTTIDGHYIVSNGEEDIALTSFSCDGSYRWTKIIGGESGDVGVGLGTDTLGGIYVAGSIFSDAYQQTINVDNDTTLAPTYKTMLLVKYDTAGNFQWLRMPEPDTLSSPSISNQFNMDVSPNGNCYWYCLLAPGSYGNGNYVATYPYDYFGNRGSCVYALKYDRYGNCTGGVHLDMSYAGTVMSEKKFTKDFLTGYYYFGGAIYSNTDTLTIGNTLVNKTLYLACFDSTGSMKWLQQNGSTEFLSSGAVKPTVDNQGNIYLTGGTIPGDSWGTYNFTNSLTTLPYRFPFLLKFDKNGNLLWGTNASTMTGVTGEAVTFANGEVGMASEYGGKIDWNGLGANNVSSQSEGFNVFFARFNASTGAIISFDTLASSLNKNDYTTALSADKQGNFYIGGTFEGTLYVGNSTIYNQSSQHDGFIAKFGSANCNCTLPTAHYTHNGLQSGGTISFNYDGSTPVDSVVWDFGDGESGSGSSVTHNYPQDGSYTVCATAYNDCGSNMYCETLQVGDVGIGKIPGFADISVYPNPATQTLTIEHAAAGTRLDVYNTLGGRVLHTVLQGDKDQVDVSRLAPGIYLMRFTDKDGRKGNARFVKQ